MAEKTPLTVLKQHRADAGVTQEALAGDLGVSVMTVSRWETGERKIAAERLSDVSEKTGIPKRELRPDLAESMQEIAQ